MILELHVWGDDELSIIEPECIAAAWLLSIHLVPQKVKFRIVKSNNTNLAESERLPLLIAPFADAYTKVEGFTEIANYISTQYPLDSTKFVPDGKLSPKDQLINSCLQSYVRKTLHNVHQYNLYVNTKNYENYTRKLFSHYLPFPMMYNQPLKFHKNACEQVKLIGLGNNKSGFFSFGGGGEDEVGDTELVNDDEDEESQPVAISALHEKMLLAKSKDKTIMREARNSFRCVALFHGYIQHLMKLFDELNPSSPVEYAYLFKSKKISSSELLLYAYIYTLTFNGLPDQNIAEHLKTEFPAFWKFATTIITALQDNLKPGNLRTAKGKEVPSLWNEIGSLVGLISYKEPY
ncbi:hypothetical protein FT663_01822 [Candidozyma haemuli var. vulneris]|uniref:Mitochondrial outer membrane transport complex Sam37/metaxin N-terminal domain-containing protein n=1 Tax=Candidozyma haemuli TaxID=45357 RepID=A0A2V1AZ46_9ASCO|nr:hypothetical protein CXQ85_002839 [[Candida] haemuloni]KAF3991056.1 hypothetical protein FT662_01884 [[Candida] haemuloni var. vulneris]KAF3993654.1 hypothetical protein FT663_01822 [[Candida] haemuloni var. vulneris]PVH23112.1 hypothetical protein CXQ85_002839 [[Candida] haemuloni]